MVPAYHFNPRSPHGERRQGGGRQSQHHRISIHAPRTGSDGVTTTQQMLQSIFQSTLPARGATSVSAKRKKLSSDFNPRSPHGERRQAQFAGNLLPHFNPRSPHGERPWGKLLSFYQCDFNPRSPHGERRVAFTRQANESQFQSTLPARGATPCLRFPCCP